MNLIPSRRLLVACILAVAFCTGESRAQQTYPQVASDDAAGFKAIFDGRSLAGWEGDPKYWRVEDGAIVGQITPGNEIKRNTFIIWRGGVTRDFELKLQYRISREGNSGINYRSVVLADADFALKGYQFDLDGGGKSNADKVRHTGNNYEERGRTFMALRGQVTRAVDGGKRRIIGAVGDYRELAGGIREEDWNDVHIIARGGTIVHMLNGQAMSILIDADKVNRALEGKLGMQVHTGPPMKVEFREIRLMQL